MQLLILLLLLSAFQTCAANKDTLPVFLIDSENVTSHSKILPNPFVRMNPSSFADLINGAIKLSQCVIIFVEDKLCTEDISLKDNLGTPYHHLHKGLLNKNVKYIPSVAEPYKTLTQIVRPEKSNVFYSPGVKLQLLDSSKYLYIYFKDGSKETRAQTLRKHDAIMQEVYSTVRQQRGPIFALYTGKVNPIAVKKMEFVPVKPKNAPRDIGVVVASEGALFRFSGVYASSSLRRSMFNQMPLIGEETWTRRKLSTTMAYTEFELQFNFSFEDDKWLLDNVALLESGEEVGRTDMGVGAPWNWSYVCGEPLLIVNTRDGSTITISQYQIQPTRPKKSRRQEGEEGAQRPNEVEEEEGEGTEEEEGKVEGQDKTADPTKCFGQTVNCGPYFNTHILSGLFVTFIWLGIVTYGIVALYNCGVNDKFDDPNGKEVITSTDFK